MIRNWVVYVADDHAHRIPMAVGWIEQQRREIRSNPHEAEGDEGYTILIDEPEFFMFLSHSGAWTMTEPRLISYIKVKE